VVGNTGTLFRLNLPESSQRRGPESSGAGPLYSIRETRYPRPWDYRNYLFLRALRGAGVGSREEEHTSQGLLEQHQQADGSVFIPDVLRPYMSGIERISAAAKGL